MFLLQRGFVISRFFFIYFTIIGGVKKIVRYTEDFVKVRYIEVSLYVTNVTFVEYKSTMQNV